MNGFKTFAGTPQGAAAVSGLVRAAVMVAVGFAGNRIAPDQAELITNLTIMMVTVALGFTGVTVAQVAARTEPAIKTTKTEVTATETDPK